MCILRPSRGLIAPIFALLLVFTASAKDGRDFAGSYTLTNISEKGDSIHVTLNLDLSNDSGIDLSQVSVVVRQSQPEAAVIDTFAPIESWRNGQNAVVSHEFTIQRREYDRWTTHGQPTVFIVYTDRDGQTWERTAQLNSRPANSF